MIRVLSFGEILFDVFGEKEELGGAPFNFCAGITRLGAKGYLYSAIGNDARGERARSACEGFGVDTEYLAVVDCPTGVCIVERDENGEPSYNLARGMAYDVIPLQKKAFDSEYDVFYFGTLSQRSPASRSTLESLLESGSFKEVFFDVNLRMDYYNAEMIKKGMEYATILKINLDECKYLADNGIVNGIAPKRNDTASLKACAGQICESYRNIGCVIITMDSDGAFVYKRNGETAMDSHPSECISAVGAGDAFSAAFVKCYIDGKPLCECVKKACILGAYTVCFEGALPPLSEEIKKEIL